MKLAFLIPILAYVLFSLIKGVPLMTITPDGELYKNLAENWLNGTGLKNTIRQENVIVPPLFPLVIGLILYVFRDISYVFLLQFILLGLTGVVIYRVCVLLFGSRMAGTLAVVLFSLHPVMLNNGPGKLLTETAYTFFVAVIAYLGVRVLMKRNIVVSAALFILLFSLSLMMRPHLLFLLPLVIGYLIFEAYKKRMKWQLPLLAVVLPAVMIASNYMYNVKVHNKPVMFENYSGMNLYIANNPETKVQFYSSSTVDQFVGDEFFKYKNTELTKKSAVLKEKAVDYILEEPGDFFVRTIQKMNLFFQGISRFDTGLTLLFLAGYAVACIRLKYVRPALVVIGLYVLYFAVLSSVGLLVSTQRYRLPIIPVYIVFSSYILWFGWRLLRNGIRRFR
ncbi:glycosyltransferase family 39 protein [Fictibacillus aquaticus]|uniref:Glycosyltransferase RgtA/B/C/D-like domain-containing protein n=1 Tax=Fictibacillus aquaticus TaxID=2021314 RepID=A0A235FAH5_9BACL|nr:glycosyltransferase family 39 protein [Fictibacillus aquaticus]OYD57745.1 hypothetical protein CGZ90_13885 [Fictibacillus aquaticus]